MREEIERMRKEKNGMKDNSKELEVLKEKEKDSEMIILNMQNEMKNIEEDVSITNLINYNNSLLINTILDKKSNFGKWIINAIELWNNIRKEWLLIKNCKIWGRT